MRNGAADAAAPALVEVPAAPVDVAVPAFSLLDAELLAWDTMLDAEVIWAPATVVLDPPEAPPTAFDAVDSAP
jgi:hypothetical protein